MQGHHQQKGMLCDAPLMPIDIADGATSGESGELNPIGTRPCGMNDAQRIHPGIFPSRFKCAPDQNIHLAQQFSHRRIIFVRKSFELVRDGELPR